MGQQLINWVYDLKAFARPAGFIGSNPGFFEQIGNAIQITGMRMAFEVKKSLGKEPNTCKITIDNLSEQTRQFLDQKPIGIFFAAGYDNAPRLLVQGDLMRAYSELKGTNYETTLQVSDGGRAFAFARTAKSYKAGVRVIQVIQDCARTMGLQVPQALLDSPDLKQALASGLTLHGPTRTAMTDALAPYGYNWSMQNGTLQILKDGQNMAGRAFVIDQSTGLIGSPKRTIPDKPKGKSELTFDVLLYPELFPGCQVQVASKTYNGLFRVKELEAKGDTHGDDWKSSAKAT